MRRANLFIQNKFFSPLFILFFFKAASLLSREANIPVHNFFVVVQLVLKQFQVYSTTPIYAPIVNQVFGLLGVKLLTNADQSVAVLHTKKGKKKKTTITTTKKTKDLIKFHMVYEIISALEFRHKQYLDSIALNSQMKNVLFT